MKTAAIICSSQVSSTTLHQPSSLSPTCYLRRHGTRSHDEDSHFQTGASAYPFPVRAHRLRPHPSSLVLRATGHSAGDPLYPGCGFYATSSNTALVRNSDITVNYEFTVEDAATYKDRFTGIIPMTKVAGLLYEYACHEGNYGMVNILRGARMQETANAREQ